TLRQRSRSSVPIVPATSVGRNSTSTAPTACSRLHSTAATVYHSATGTDTSILFHRSRFVVNKCPQRGVVEHKTAQPTVSRIVFTPVRQRSPECLIIRIHDHGGHAD